MKKIIVLTLALSIVIGVKAQVGIGNANPEATSTLDLSNSNNRGLLLPTTSSVAGMSSVERMLYYFNDNIYFRTSTGYNALSPWKFKFNGGIANDVFYTLGGNIGIGSTNITVAPLAPLHIETVNPIDLSSNNGSFLIGNTLSTNIVFNSTEMQTRNAGSSAPLQINEDGGDVTFGSASSAVNVEVAGTVKQYDKTTASYYDLVPTGSIIMWYGTTANVPVGWALCNGAIYTKSDNSGNITAPDLRGRFVVAQGSNGANNYLPHNRGGQDAVTLSTSQMPNHTHGRGSLSTSSAGAHQHTHKGYNKVTGGVSGGDHVRSRSTISGDATDNIGNNTGNHTHSISGSISAAGGSGSHENRPSYYALVYIIKL